MFTPMSFRRRKSRIGPAFQAVIPPVLSSRDRQELKRLYDYEQSLAEHCRTLSSLSGIVEPVSSSGSMNSSSSAINTKQPAIAPYSVNDPAIDHRVDPLVFEVSKSRPPTHFDYAQYVANSKLIDTLSFSIRFTLTLIRWHIDTLTHSLTLSLYWYIPPLSLSLFPQQHIEHGDGHKNEKKETWRSNEWPLQWHREWSEYAYPTTTRQTTETKPSFDTICILNVYSVHSLIDTQPVEWCQWSTDSSSHHPIEPSVSVSIFGQSHIEWNH